MFPILEVSMKHVKKIFALALSLALVFGFASCNASDDDDDGSVTLIFDSSYKATVSNADGTTTTYSMTISLGSTVTSGTWSFSDGGSKSISGTLVSDKYGSYIGKEAVVVTLSTTKGSWKTFQIRPDKTFAFELYVHDFDY